MAQYATLLNFVILWIGEHWIELLLVLLWATQLLLWLKVKPLCKPTAVTAQQQTAALAGNLILQAVVKRLRKGLEAGPDATEFITRQQRRLQRQGIQPPKTVAECDALLSTKVKEKQS